MVQGLSCSEACGIFPDQGLNLCLLHWQVDSLPLSHLGSPVRVDKASDSTRYMENVLCQKLSLSPIHHAFSLSNPRVFAFAVHSNLSLKKKKSSVVSNSATPWTITYQAPPSIGFSGQEYWSGLPFPSPGDLPHPGIQPRSPAL